MVSLVHAGDAVLDILLRLLQAALRSLLQLLGRLPALEAFRRTLRLGGEGGEVLGFLVLAAIVAALVLFFLLLRVTRRTGPEGGGRALRDLFPGSR